MRGLQIQTETLLQAADEAVDGLVMAEPALQSRVQQVAANLNPDQAPLLQVRFWGAGPGGRRERGR